MYDKPKCLSDIKNHLVEKNTYSDIYINRVMSYLEKNDDLAEEFHELLPKNTILDSYIEVKGVSLRLLGATTLLSRSAIYIVLSRLKEEDMPVGLIIEEELENLQKGKKS